MSGGYPLHIDATCEYGKGGLFICLDGWRGRVLHAVKIRSENEKELRPCVEETTSRFGDPVAVIRDLSTAEAGAVDNLRDRCIPDLVCHYHFLSAIGKKLLDDNYAVLRNLLRQSKVRTQLRELLRELRHNCSTEVYDGKQGRGRLREDLLALVVSVLEGEGHKDLPYPFSLCISISTNAAEKRYNALNAGYHYLIPRWNDVSSSSYPKSWPGSMRYHAWAGWYPDWRKTNVHLLSCEISCASPTRNSHAVTSITSRQRSSRS